MEQNAKVISRQEAAKLALYAAIDEDLQRNPPGGIWETGHCAFSLIQKLKDKDLNHWEEIQAHMVMDVVTSMYERRLQTRLRKQVKAEARADARQGLLALPGFNLVSPWVKLDSGIAPLNKVTTKQHRESVEERAARIKASSYPRWSEDRMKREKAALAQERKLDRKIAPLTAGAPDMEMGRAMELFQAKLETPKVKRWSKGGKAKNRRYVKSTT